MTWCSEESTHGQFAENHFHKYSSNVIESPAGRCCSVISMTCVRFHFQQWSDESAGEDSTVPSTTLGSGRNLSGWSMLSLRLTASTPEVQASYNSDEARTTAPPDTLTLQCGNQQRLLTVSYTTHFVFFSRLQTHTPSRAHGYKCIPHRLEKYIHISLTCAEDLLYNHNVSQCVFWNYGSNLIRNV